MTPKPEPGMWEVQTGPPQLVGYSYAVFSPDKKWRYSLVRCDDPNLALLRWIGLNPSTADAFNDDPTVTRCRIRAARNGYGGIVMQNLYALKSTDPSELQHATDPVGEHADRWLKHTGEKLGATVLAWGADKAVTAERVRTLLELIAGDGNILHLGTTAGGQPKHPLYVPYDTPLRAWPESEQDQKDHPDGISRPGET